MRLAGLLIGAVLTAAPVAQAQTTPVQRKQVIEALASALAKNYVYPEIGAKYAAALREKVASVDYAVADDFEFAKKVQTDLDAVNKDRHLRLLAPLPSAGAGGPRIVRGPGPGPGMKAIEAAQKLTPDIAYIRFGVFPGDPETMADLEKFHAANAGVKTLIVDARGHRGGGVDEIDAMFADLFTKQVDLVQMETAQAVIDARPDMLMQGPTFRSVATKPGMVRLQHFTKPSAHPRLANTKLYVLQSGFSGSAAEHFLLEVKMSGRGTLVGETSAGAGHFGFPLDLPNGFSTFIPAGRTFDPKTDWDWEGKGVAPDMAVPAAEALVAALKDAGVVQAEAEALDAKVGFLMPKRRAGGGPVIVVREAPPG
jgi:hypothetical protein